MNSYCLSKNSDDQLRTTLFAFSLENARFHTFSLEFNCVILTVCRLMCLNSLHNLRKCSHTTLYSLNEHMHIQRIFNNMEYENKLKNFHIQFNCILHNIFIIQRFIFHREIHFNCGGDVCQIVKCCCLRYLRFRHFVQLTPLCIEPE